MSNQTFIEAAAKEYVKQDPSAWNEDEKAFKAGAVFIILFLKDTFKHPKNQGVWSSDSIVNSVERLLTLKGDENESK